MTKAQKETYQKRLRALEIARKERSRRASLRRRLAVQRGGASAADFVKATGSISVGGATQAMELLNQAQTFDNMREETDILRRDRDFWRRMAFDLMTRSLPEASKWAKDRIDVSAPLTNFSQSPTLTQ